MKSLDQIFCVESKVSAGIHQLLSEPLLELHIKEGVQGYREPDLSFMGCFFCLPLTY